MSAVVAYMSEVLRVLRRGGTFLCTSFGAPTERLRHLQLPDFEVSTRSLPKEGHCSVHYAYICRKITRTPPAAEPSFQGGIMRLDELD